MTTRQFMEQIMAQNTQILENLDSLNKRVTTLESGKLSTAKTSSKKSTTSTKKKSSPKSETPKQTREERLTEKFGDKEARTKFVELRKKVADEFSTLAKANDCYIPKKSYMKVLTATTESLNGKFNKATVKKAFIAAAK